MTLASSNFREETATVPVLRLCGIIAIAVARLAVHAPRMLVALLRRDRQARNRALGEALAGTAESLGPVFIKAAQMFSYRSDLLPIDFLKPLEKLQDRVRPLRQGEARRAVEASLGRPVGEVFAAFEDQPVACGSVAVVCRATGRNGERLAVKVVRPGVAQQIARDLDCLRWLAGFVARSRFGQGTPVLQTYDLIATMIAMQGDMRAESRNLSRLRDLVSSQPRVGMPDASYTAATAEVLVMQFVDALAWRNIEIGDADFRSAANDLLVALYNMIFKLGVVHCDMHPGNILLRPDGTVVLIDAGLVAHLSDDDRRCFRYLFLALAFNNSSNCAAAILESALKVPRDLDRSAFEREIQALVTSFHGRKAGEFLVAEFVFRIFEIERRHGIFGPPGFAAAIWALVMFEGLVRARYPDLDFQAVARPFALSLRG
jgi:ubiquinone biosynthesis protein